MAKLSADFKALAARIGATATPGDMYKYTVTIQGHKLGISPYLAERDPWVACKWLPGDEQARAAWLAAPDDQGQADALYSVYRATVEKEAQAIKAKNLPHNNPFSLKWNHYGPDCVQQLAAGLALYINPNQLEA
jgi:hypothetical protein